MDKQFLNELEDQLSQFSGSKIHINQFQHVAGGDINSTYKLITDHNNYFLKINEAQKYPGLFHQEKIGLQELNKTAALTVPDPIAEGEFQKQAYLLTTFIEKGKARADFWKTFAYSLVQVHKTTAEKYGFYETNYIGTLLQNNEWHSSWTDFYIQQRLSPLVQKAYDNKLMSSTLLNRMEALYRQLPEIIIEDQPALLHGDLWGGNFMVGEDGKACIFDPAVYFGHREIDIAMTDLFGGFDKQFYHYYNEAFPMADGWEKRLGIYQLYPLLVHVNLFGAGYLSGIERTLQSWKI